MKSRSVLVQTVYKSSQTFPLLVHKRFLNAFKSPWDACVIIWQMCRSNHTVHLTVPALQHTTSHTTQNTTKHTLTQHNTTQHTPHHPPPVETERRTSSMCQDCEGCDIVQSDHAPQAGVAQGIFDGELVRRRVGHQVELEEEQDEEVERRVRRDAQRTTHRCACMDDME